MVASFPHVGFVALALLIGIGGFVAAFARSKRRLRTRGERHVFWDYLLVWLLLFDKSPGAAKGKGGERLPANREIVGWLIVVALIVLLMVFRW